MPEHLPAHVDEIYSAAHNQVNAPVQV